jgi:arylsulfatase A-like enzyme
MRGKNPMFNSMIDQADRPRMSLPPALKRGASRCLLWGLLLTQWVIGRPAMSAEHDKPSVLFIAVDDLNCRIGCYGDPIVRTPNLDRLAARGVRFDRAYCQFPLCNATRSSVLSGRYPTTTGVLDNFTWLVLPDGDQTLLPTRFEKSGYAVSLNGKIFHVANTGFRPGDAALSKTDDPWLTPDERRQQQRDHPNPPDGFFLDARAMTPQAERYTAANRYGALPPHDAGPDVPIADAAMADLRRFAGSGGPFFLGVGFKKPHVPLLAPQEFIDLYAGVELPLPPDFDTAPHGGHGMPPQEFRGNRDLFSGRAFTRDEARQVIRCYYACITYMDHQLGRVLDELDRLGLVKNTVVVLWGDHGWHLSEKGLWAKDTLFEASARGPLIIVDPRLPATAGTSSPRVVQYLDVYPTLLDLCGLPLPEFLEGVSLAPLLKNPQAPWDRPAYTVQTRGWSLGRSIRTERWRYTEWDTAGNSRALFDHDADPHELRNLALDPAHAKTVARLREQLRASPVSTGKYSPPQP